MAKRPSLLENIRGTADLDKATDQETGAGTNQEGTGFLGARMERAGEVFRGERQKRVHYRIDPEQCVLWGRHNRDYERLNEVECEDLISGFRAQGQQFPAIVRELPQGSEHAYEIICGARRRWTAKFLGVPLLVEVRKLTDEEAFRLQDIENRERKDISDWERANDYYRALHHDGYYETQSQMATALGVSNAWLSRYLDLAKLPADFVDACSDPRDITINSVRRLKGMFKENGAKAAVDNATRKELAEIKREQDKLAANGQPSIQVKDIVSRIVAAGTAATQSKKGGSKSEEIKSSKGDLIMKINRGRQSMSLTLPNKPKVSREELSGEIAKLLDAMYDSV